MTKLQRALKRVKNYSHNIKMVGIDNWGDEIWLQQAELDNKIVYIKYLVDPYVATEMINEAACYDIQDWEAEAVAILDDKEIKK